MSIQGLGTRLTAKFISISPFIPLNTYKRVYHLRNKAARRDGYAYPTANRAPKADHAVDDVGYRHHSAMSAICVMPGNESLFMNSALIFTLRYYSKVNPVHIARGCLKQPRCQSDWVNNVFSIGFI